MLNLPTAGADQRRGECYRVLSTDRLGRSRWVIYALNSIYAFQGREQVQALP